MWHVCASLADSTHFAWWQTTHHSRTSYHKLEGLSPGWVKERQRCMCGVFFFFPRLSFFSGSAKTPKPGIPAPFQMNAYVSVTMREVSTEASDRNSILTLCATKVLVCANPRDCFFLICSRDPLGSATPHMSVYAESERESGENPRLKNTHHFLQCPLPFYI